jgi:PmbA protein
MFDDPDVYALADYGLQFALKKNSELKCIEIFFGENNYISIEIEENSVKNSEIGSDNGVSVRLINKKGSLGFAFTNKVNRVSIENIIKTALKMMNAGTEDPDFKDLPNKTIKYPNVKNLFDENLKNLEIEDTLNYVEDLIRVCKQDELAISQSANFLSNYTKSYIFNSNGLEATEKETSCTISSNIIVKDKISKETSFGYDWQSERLLCKLDAINVVKNAIRKAKLNLNRIRVKTKKMPLILTPIGTIKMILEPLASAINAETFQYKRSFLISKRGEIIGSKYLNIEDNALIDSAIGSASFDGEGVPCKNKEIFEKGKFLETGLLHNSYTAGKDNVESTGNASRNSYSSIPSIGISNFIFKPQDVKKDEIIKEISEGILLDYTGDSPNISTGDFSGLILHGNLIKDGEIKNALNETMFGVNLLDFFKNIDSVSKEFDVYGSFQAPFVKVNDVQIIGS